MRLILAVLILLAASACARTPPSRSFNDVDEAAMGRVEEGAARNGVRVYWVNPPRKPAALRETN